MASSASAVMQTFCGSSVTRPRSGLTQFSVPSGGYVLPIKRNVVFKVRSMAEQQEGESTEKKSGGASPLGTPTPSPSRKPKVSTDFSDLLAFSGPAPERINGRLAMIGFVAAIGVELANGQDIFSQVQNGGFQLFLGTSILLSMASLIPLFKGVTVESKSGNLMTSDAEMWNGRFAMLGLVALALTEFVKGGALV
ncbi:hypothetical protein RD792_010018 [Penstemon davidsonii]|uniref:Early light-induced protein n=1 Tax=Penstemon davidsonii TaxID=160366 RepID=A0ABR0D209_9LAMI|nr:hypothetical protein RD792_010018 [Penstemon davidsonii]